MRAAITGAYGYSGRYIAQRLLQEGHEVITLTNSVDRENPFGTRVPAVPFHFDEPARLKQSLQGVDVLFNTYWVRFDHRLFNHESAVQNTKVLFQAAKQAGVSRIIHVSITKPDPQSDLAYFRGKAELESALQQTGISHCILRPTVLFGREDVLINNIAWALRRLPVFGVFGAGNYRLQPIYVEDFARAAVEQIGGGEKAIINATGPETYSYRELVRMIAEELAVARLIISVPPALAYIACRLLGGFVRDVVITREEIRGLMEERLWVEGKALGTTSLRAWVCANRHTLGKRYTSEMARRINRRTKYSTN